MSSFHSVELADFSLNASAPFPILLEINSMEMLSTYTRAVHFPSSCMAKT